VHCSCASMQFSIHCRFVHRTSCMNDLVLLMWGRVDQKSTLFSRFTSDANTGRRVIVQAVHKLDERNIVSPIFAATMGSPSQLGMSWTHVFTSNGKHFLFPVCSNFTVLWIFQSFFSKLPSLYRHSDVCFWGFYLLFSLSFLVPSCYN
jgi:hypothetical protein